MPKPSNLSTAFALLTQKIETHLEESQRLHAGIDTHLQDIGDDVKSLLLTRAGIRGAWKTAALVAGSVSTISSAIGLYLKWH